MKRLVLLLLTVLFLAGCGDQQMPTTETTTEPAATEPPGLYLPEGEVEKGTNGAVRAYGLESDSYVWAAPYGQNLLLATDAGELTLLSGDRCVPEVTAVTGTELSSSAAALGAEYGCAYYLDKAAKELVVLGSDLQPTKRIAMPEEFQGEPVLRGQTMEVFYCVGQEIRALDPETGISRLVKQQSCQSSQLLGSCFDGEVLICENVDTLDQRHILYVDAATGQTLAGDDHVYQLHTSGDAYFAMRLDGVIQQQIFGTLEAGSKQLHIPQTSDIAPVLSVGGVIAWQVSEAGLGISFYDTASGLRTAAVELPGVQAPVCVTSDSAYIWILAGDEDRVLYRWDVSKSPVTDETVYTTPLYTKDAPDETGLALCLTRAEELSDQFEVRVRIWQDALKAPGVYTLEPEYQTEVIAQWLEDLADAMALFPEEFFDECAEGSDSGRLRICLVRSVATGEQTVHYWQDAEAYILMTPGTDVQRELIQTIGYVLDSHVIGNSLAFDTWDTLNPAGFTYTDEPDGAWLKGRSCAFVDRQAKTSSREDRARLFAAAMTEDNQELFAGAMLQAKLLRLCQGIRDSFDLEKYPQTLPWEQYLSESLAYTEE